MVAIARSIPFYLSQPVRLFRHYDRLNLRFDFLAGLTVAVILLPQAIAFALIAELPPAMGLYAAIIGALIGGLWGSSNQIHTGPTNAISLLVFSVLLTVAEPGTPEFIIAAGMLAVMAGALQLVMGLARLGMLVNFVSHSVIVGFATGAAVLIAVKQLRPLMGVEFESHNLVEVFQGVITSVPDIHIATFVLGVGTMVIIVVIRRINRKLPAALIAMIVASVAVYFLGPGEAGVDVIGELPKSLPPLTQLPLLDLQLIAELSAGALAVGAIGLVETTAISRSIATQTGQRLDSNQEFVGQGLANIAAGFFSGYPVAGSFSRSAVNFDSDAKTPVAAMFSAGFVLFAMFLLAPLAVYLPIAALSGVLIITAIGMIKRDEIARIWRGARPDAIIMLVTFLGTLFLEIEFAVLLGIFLSLAFYIYSTSLPRVLPVQPDEQFRHLTHRPDMDPCPQLAILEIMGDLYFGAVNHVEEEILKHASQHPEQRFLLLRMDNVLNMDFSGIHMLETIVPAYRDRGGDVYMVRVHQPVMDIMQSTAFYQHLGADHFLTEDTAIAQLFHRTLDPAVCIYECEVRAFKECQSLPKQTYAIDLVPVSVGDADRVPRVPALELWKQLHAESPPLVLDVREPREFHRGHVPDAELMPLPQLLEDGYDLPRDRPVVLTCRTGRRSLRAAHAMQQRGYENLSILDGGVLAWEAANLLEAIDVE